MHTSLTIIGHVRSCYKDRSQCPRQPHHGMPCSIIEIREEFSPALDGLKPGDELVVLTWLHLGDRDTLRCHPRGDTSIPKKGIFATRSPDRPNPIGLHRVTLLKIEDTTLTVHPLEVMDQTPVIDIKPVRFDVYKRSWGPHIDVHVAEGIKEAGYRGWIRGLFSGYNGNISVRQDNIMVITRSGCNKSSLAPGDLVAIDMETQSPYGEATPSSEWRMHLEIYHAQPECRAIVHTHPPHLLAAISTNTSFLEEMEIFEGKLFKEEMAMVEPFPPGSQKLAQEAAQWATDNGLLILKSHGLVALGRDVLHALSLSEELEMLAQLYLMGTH